MDHDQRFKTLIKAFFTEFLLLFFASWARRLNTADVEWFDKEVFPDPPEGFRRTLDLVGKVTTLEAVPELGGGQGSSFLALVHIEIESPDKAKPLRPRMFHSYVYLRDEYGLPVLPIALYLKVGLDGIGVDVYEEKFWEFRPVHFEYLYVGLPALDAVEYVQGENWLGVTLASLMRIQRIVWPGWEPRRCDASRQHRLVSKSDSYWRNASRRICPWIRNSNGSSKDWSLQNLTKEYRP
jgi:hypothetical protein